MKNKELKTMKELKCAVRDCNSKLCTDDMKQVFVKELKSEAVKWIKEDKRNLGDLWDLDEWIKNFFNLTSEDLK